MNINREEIIWAAGLFEGEGCISRSIKINPRSCCRQKLLLTTTDYDVVLRFYKAVGELGNIYDRKDSKSVAGKDHKHQWAWIVSSFEHTQAIIAMFWPWLGKRRRARAIEVLSDAVTLLKYPAKGINLQCSMKDCTNVVKAKGLCRLHYVRACTLVAKLGWIGWKFKNNGLIEIT